MKFTKHDGTFFDLEVVGTTPKYNINYELMFTDSGLIKSIDRGIATDRHSAIFSFVNSPKYINDMLHELQLLRDNGKPVVISEFGEPVFADNLDYSGSITCIVLKVAEQKGAEFNVQSINIEFLVSGAQYNSKTPNLPDGLICVASNYKAYSVWDTRVNESYLRSNWVVDRQADTYEFEGEYVLCIDENIELLNFWEKVVRGKTFSINDGDFGVDYMFGEDGGNTNHNVIISDISYKYLSSRHRQTVIKLIKVG